MKVCYLLFYRFGIEVRVVDQTSTALFVLTDDATFDFYDQHITDINDAPNTYIREDPFFLYKMDEKVVGLF